MNKKYQVFQEDHSDCAAACLLSIIKYYGGYISLEDIKKLVNTTKKGTNAYDLIEGAKEIGFDAVGQKCSFEELVIKEYPLPLIAHVKKDNYYHFVIIYNINDRKKKITLMDPSIGFKNISYEDFKKIFLNVVLIFVKVKDLPKKAKNKDLLKIFKTIMLENKYKLFITLLLSFILFILSLIQIRFYKSLFTSSSSLSNIKYTVISFVVILIVKNIIELLHNYKIIKIKYITDKKMNKEVLKKIFLLSYEYLKNKTTGEIISRINDIETLKDVFLDLILNIFVNILLIIIFLFLIFNISLYLGILSLIYVILYIFLSILYKSIYEKKTKEVQEFKGKYTNDLVESVESLETINNLNIKDYFSLKISNSYGNYIKKIKSFNKLTTTEHFFKSILSDLSLLILIVSMFYLINKGLLPISNTIIIYMIFTYIMNALSNLLEKIPYITYAINNVEKISILLNNSVEIKNDYNNIGDIKISKLSYYNSGKNIIHDLNLLIPIKTKMCLSGRSGIGKSTLLKIILKYKSDYQGRVSINNVDLNELSRDFIWNNFVYVGQNEKLFVGSLKYNITLDRDVNNLDLNKVINICCLNEIINCNPLKENIYVESDGFNLSGGERQRIILARGLLKKCDYIFIDEALSEVDINLEIKIVKNILTEFKDKTIIYVSHKKEVQVLFESIYNLERSTYE